jgi:hypothetical protein
MRGGLYYPKILDSTGCPGGRCIAFEKIDGTNMHYDWHVDFGWHAFGTRRDSFNIDGKGINAFLTAHRGLEEAALAFNPMADPLERVFRKRYPKHPAFRVFAEFVGDHSFAGEHVEEEPKRLVLFDVIADWSESQGDSHDPMGMLGPEEFIEAFEGVVEIPRILFRGKFSGQLVEDIRKGKFGVDEGAVIKGIKGPPYWVAKVKTDAYLERLKNRFGDRWPDFWE